MSNTIDCSIMSHPACVEPDVAESSSGEQSTASAPAAPQREPPAFFASYDCVNACASSQGVAALVNGAIAGLGCIALPPACPAFLVAAPLTILEACDQACRELESK